MAKKPKDNDWKDRLNVVYSTLKKEGYTQTKPVG